MAQSIRTIWFARTAGWFEFDPDVGLVKVKTDDLRVKQAKASDKMFLIGTDLSTTSDPAQTAKIESLTQALDAEKEKVVAAQVEATNAQARTRSLEESLAIAERNFASRTGEVAKVKELLEKAEAALLEAKKNPQADPTAVASLTQKVSDLDGKVASLTVDLVKANEAKELADKEKNAALQKLKDATAPPQPAPKPAPASTPPAAPQKSFREKATPFVATAAIAFLLGVVLVLSNYYRSTPSNVASVPADTSATAARLDDLEAKQAAEEKDKKDFAERYKKRKTVPLIPFDTESK